LATWVRFDDNVPKVLRINKDPKKRKVKPVMVKGHEVEAMFFKAEELKDEPGIEKDLRATSHILARKIVSYLSRGITDVRITKSGNGFNTVYEVEALGQQPQQQQQQKLGQ
jgi:hypothetical protein